MFVQNQQYFFLSWASHHGGQQGGRVQPDDNLLAGPMVKKKEVKLCVESSRLIKPVLISGFDSIERRSGTTTPGHDAGLSLEIPPSKNRYSLIHLSRVRK